MSSYYTYSTKVTTLGKGSQDKLINLDVVNRKVRFSSEELTNVKRDFRFFSSELSNVYGEVFNMKVSGLDNKMLNILSAGTDKEMLNFIKKFNRGIISENPNYILNDQSVFFIALYRERKFIVILDKINNLKTNKRCFNIKGDILTKVQDTLSSNGELIRDGEKYKAIYKDSVIIHLERKVLSEVTNIPTKSISISTKSTNNNQELPDANVQREPSVSNLQREQSVSNVSSEESGQSVKTKPNAYSVKSEPNVSGAPTEQVGPRESSVSNTAENANKPEKTLEKGKDNENVSKFKLFYINWLYEGAKKLFKEIIKVLPRPYNIVWSILIIRLLKRVIYSVIGFLEASLLGWFITNPENWKIPSMEIQLPRWVSNTAESANVQIAEINLKTFPEINNITLPEINPKTLPELKIFTDSVDTGRELYKDGLDGLSGGQESNLPIILFGAVVIAVIIYIGWKHELFNDFLPKEGLFSNLRYKGNFSTDNNLLSNIRNSNNDSSENGGYDIDFIKKLVDDGNHSLKLTPYEDSDLTFFELVCPKNNQVAKYEQIAKTNEKIRNDTIAECERLLEINNKKVSDTIAEYERVAQIKDKKVSDTIAEYERMCQVNDKAASDQIIEYMRRAQQSELAANDKIAEYKRMTETKSEAKRS